MYLLIDAGNSRLKIGCHDGHRWLDQRAVSHGVGLPLPAGCEPTQIVISNVAGASVQEQLEKWLAPWRERIEWFAATERCCGLSNGYEKPSQLGADRWAAAVAAWNMVRGACIVVCAGTATTIDVVQAEGRFGGGCILPGLDMMRASLAQGTAALPMAQQQGGLRTLPANTHDAIISGCLHATLGAIERMARLLPSGAPLVLSGGAAGHLSMHLGMPVVGVPMLVLEGLLCVARSRDNPAP